MGGKYRRDRRAVIGIGSALVLLFTISTTARPPAAHATVGETASLTLSSSKIYAGSNQVVIATVTADTAGHAQYNVQASFSSSGDVVFASGHTCSTNNSGQCSVGISPGSTQGTQTITVNVTGIEWSATASASLYQYAAPTSFTWSVPLSPQSLTADGMALATGTVDIVNAEGGIPGEPLSVSVGVPSSFLNEGPESYVEPSFSNGEVKDNGNGTYTIDVNAPPPDPSKGSSAYSVTVTASIPDSANNSASESLGLTNPTGRVNGPLHVSGTQVLDATGSPVTLKGVNVLDLLYPYGSDDAPLTPLRVGNLYEWGGNYIRLELSSDLLLQNCTPSGSNKATYYDPNYATEVQNQVNLITSFGIYVILDLHGTDPGCDFQDSGHAGGEIAPPLPSVSDGNTFFNELLSPPYDFGSNPLVGFELYNEPHVCSTGSGGAESSYGVSCTEPQEAQAWVNGGTITVGGTTIDGQTVNGSSYDGAGMADLYEQIRSVDGDASSLIFIDANYYASDHQTFYEMNQPSAANPVMPALSNVVDVFHYYDCQEASASTADCADATPEACSQIQNNLQHNNDFRNPQTGIYESLGEPVVEDEFGWPLDYPAYQYTNSTGLPTSITVYNHGIWVNNVIAELQSLGDGWAEFAYGSFYNLPQNGYDELASASPTSVPWQPNADGAPIQAAMQGQTLTCTDPPAGYG